MKKIVAFIAVLGIVSSLAAPVVQDQAVETHPRPLVFEQV